MLKWIFELTIFLLREPVRTYSSACALLVVFSPVLAQSQVPSIEFLDGAKLSRTNSFALSSDDSLVELSGNILTIRPPSNVSRSVTLPIELSTALNSTGLLSSFILRSDGKALVAPVRQDGHTACTYFVFDTISGVSNSGTYEGVFRVFSKGEKSTDCHSGLAANPAAEQFAFAPSVAPRDIYLIAYDGSRTTLTASLSDSITAHGRIVFLSSTQLVAGFSVTSSRVSKHVLFDLITSQQTEIAKSPGNFLSLIKALDSITLLFQQDPEPHEFRSSSVVAFNLMTMTFSTVREEGSVAYRSASSDSAFVASVGSSPLFRDGLQSSCDVSNGSPLSRSFDLCVSFGAKGSWEPLQCFFPKSQLARGALGGGLGTTRDGKVIVRLPDRLAAVSFPSTSGEDLPRYCANLELQPESSCLAFLSPPDQFGRPSFRGSGAKRTCTATFRVMVGGNPLNKGGAVKFLRKSGRTKAVTIATRNTDGKGKVSFRVKIGDFVRRKGVDPTAIFKFDGTNTLRPAEYTIAP